MKRFIILAAVAVVGCKSEVTAIYYPDRTSLSKYVAETVDSLDQCRSWVALQARQQGTGATNVGPTTPALLGARRCGDPRLHQAALGVLMKLTAEDKAWVKRVRAKYRRLFGHEQTATSDEVIVKYHFGEPETRC